MCGRQCTSCTWAAGTGKPWGTHVHLFRATASGLTPLLMKQHCYRQHDRAQTAACDMYKCSFRSTKQGDVSIHRRCTSLCRRKKLVEGTMSANIDPLNHAACVTHCTSCVGLCARSRTYPLQYRSPACDMALRHSISHPTAALRRCLRTIQSSPPTMTIPHSLISRCPVNKTTAAGASCRGS